MKNSTLETNSGLMVHEWKFKQFKKDECLKIKTVGVKFWKKIGVYASIVEKTGQNYIFDCD